MMPTAFAVEIPDWLFHPVFWSGFGAAVVIGVILVWVVMNNFNPFG